MLSLGERDFKTDKLTTQSNIRPNRIFTADKNIIIKKAATLNEAAAKSRPLSFILQTRLIHIIFSPLSLIILLWH
jgi:hypothetical protein